MYIYVYIYIYVYVYIIVWMLVLVEKMLSALKLIYTLYHIYIHTYILYTCVCTHTTIWRRARLEPSKERLRPKPTSIFSLGHFF